MTRKNFVVPVKLWALFCAILGISLTLNPILTWILSITGFAYLALQRNFKFLKTALIFYGILAVLLYLIRYQGMHMAIFSEFYVLMFWNIFPVVLVGWDLLTTPPGQLSAFLSKINLPSSFILGLLVMFRFFPTMKCELSSVRNSMRNRGLTAPLEVLRHPLVSCEYVLVPCLLRCIQIADQLSVSAVARGAEFPGKRGNYHGSSFQAIDGFALVLWSAITCFFLCIGGVRL